MGPTCQTDAMRSAPRTLVTLLALLVLVSAPASAWASDGSVPPEVRAYVTGGGLADELDDVYGDNGAGAGIPFGETTTAGPISRVFHFTEERIVGDLAGKPTRMVNEWAVPVSVAEEPVGVAIVWINTDTELPELAEFRADAEEALALAEVPDAARLVRDVASGAWFALEGELLIPLVTGASGVVEPVPVDEVELIDPAAQPLASESADGAGFLLALGVVLVLLAVVIVALFLPGRELSRVESDAGDASAAGGPTEELITRDV